MVLCGLQLILDPYTYPSLLKPNIRWSASVMQMMTLCGCGAKGNNSISKASHQSAPQFMMCEGESSYIFRTCPSLPPLTTYRNPFPPPTTLITTSTNLSLCCPRRRFRCRSPAPASSRWWPTQQCPMAGAGYSRSCPLSS